MLLQEASISDKTQFLLTRFAADDLSAWEQLALITKVRLIMSEKQEVEGMEQVLKETNILEMISAILRAPDNIEANIIRYMKLEATWILTNITFGEEDVIEQMLDDQYDFIKHFNLILEGDDA